MDSDRIQKLKVTINGNAYLVEVGDLSTSPITVKVNGQTYTVDIERTEVGEFPDQTPVLTPAKPTQCASVSERKITTPCSDGVSEKVVRAPMPGNIIHIAVKVGDPVTVGQELCSLEAMKMNNAIRSPRDGVIASIEASPGQVVNHGDILLTFE